jgi:transcriptional regulator with XRE-family HTH domain
MKKLFILSMETTIGQKIKEVFESKKMRMNDFAEKIDTVRQNVYKIFQRDSIDTELLVKISEILDHNFFQYFHPKTSGGLEGNHLKSQSSDYQEVIKKLSETEQELALAQKEIDYLKKIIDLMEERALLITKRA